jgi:hypothetical protein
MVPDKQTQELMGDFIKGWQGGASAASALRQAQLAMMARMRKDQGQAHPFFWAAFTMTGDWRSEQELYVPKTSPGACGASDGCQRVLSATTSWPMRVSRLPAAHSHVWTQASLAREMTWSRADLT